MMCSRQIPSEIRSGIEVVITGLTRNQFVSNHTWVRIPPAAPAQKFPPPLRFRLRRKLRYGGNFFAFGHDSLRWIRGRGETGGTDWGCIFFVNVTQFMIIRTLSSKWGTCSDLSFLIESNIMLRISHRFYRPMIRHHTCRSID